MTFRSSDFAALDQALRDWPSATSAPPGGLTTPAARLLLAATDAATAQGQVGSADLAVLLRHVLRAEAELSGANKSLPVPLAPPWPASTEWEAFGMRSFVDGGRQRVFADQWLPEWLSPEADPAASAFRGTFDPPLGALAGITADRFLTAATGLATYRSAGQREAIRAVLSTPNTATIIGNLPTGTGKSLVAYVEALARDTLGTTIVVVPTTSLALDQERAFRDLLGDTVRRGRFAGELAYYGELPDASRAQVRAQIADGSQGIVFTSPESLMGSLSSAVYRAAERGLVRALVIDEAHIVSHWGSEFRPAFQALAGVRTDLLRAAAAKGGFQTILLSATLTEESIVALELLFGQPGPVELISSVALRHEPSYWLASAPDEATRAARVLEGLRHLPRPLILYTTRVDAAKDWRDRLKASGFIRSMLVAGETGAGQRREAIDRLRNGTLDLVIATSAFGLGVDQPDVRAVVHACIPETIDRYYQEVGRGGRDGRPCISVLVQAPNDHAAADKLASPKLISVERGFERWDQMRIGGSLQDDGRIRLPLHVSPPDLLGDTAENRAWNMRTLLLMNRAGLLSLEATPPPRRAPEESEEDWLLRSEAAFEDYAAHTLVRLKVGNLADQTAWESAVGETRRAALKADRRARQRMNETLLAEASICRLLTETYQVTHPLPGVPKEQSLVPVAPSCGGCPSCRAAGLEARRFPAPVPNPARSAFTEHWDESIRPWFAGRYTLAATYAPREDWDDAVIPAIRKLARLGLWCLRVPAEMASRGEVETLYELTPGQVVFEFAAWRRRSAPGLPTVVVIAPGERVEANLLDDCPPRRIVIVPDDARDPRHATDTIGEYHHPAITVADIVERM